jgi:hypothetical protein
MGFPCLNISKPKNGGMDTGDFQDSFLLAVRCWAKGLSHTESLSEEGISSVVPSGSLYHEFVSFFKAVFLWVSDHALL